MIQNLPKDLVEAVQFLKFFEESSVHTKRTRAFEDAIEIFNSHLQDAPDTSHKLFIKNLKRTYTRKLLEQLPSFFTLDIYDWFGYCKLLLISVQNESEEIGKEYPHLKQNAEKFIEVWREEAIAAFQGISERSKRIN